jgi:hypothetical protein
MLQLAAVTAADTVHDVGCGDGRLLLAAARPPHGRLPGAPVGASALLDVGANAQSNTAAASGLAALVTADYTIPANASGVDVDTTFVLPAGRPLSVVDAYVVSSGTAAGSIQARTTTGGITNAMVPGATLNAITRPTTVAGNTIAAGGSLVARAATATIAGNVLRIVYKVA